VPADLRVLRVHELRVDESALTGESQPVAKDVVTLPVDISVADRTNLLSAGTLVTSGSGAGLVVETGAGTELGEIHRLVGSTTSLATPLTRKLTRFSRVLTVVILLLAAVTFAVGVARGERPVDMVTAAIALAVGAIPEGLPAAVTITLAVGVVRMARRRAVVRRLPAVETLGSVAVICTDKTGTLTENQMTVRVVTTPDHRFEVTGSGYAPDGRLLDDTGRTADPGADEALRWGLLAGAGCNDASLTTEHGAPAAVGDPTEAAMLVVARKAGLSPTRLPRLDTLPFTSERGLMATLHADPAGPRRVLLVKGAAERVLELCGTEMAADG
ncbi:MAG: cation-transporting P-type ATPase, partial [Chitinophagaceae bacterium]